MLANRHAAAIIPNCQPVAAFQMDIDPVGMAGHGLIHRIVQNLRRQMMQRALIRAADIHAGAVAYRLQPFQNFDIGGVISVGICRGTKKIGHVSTVFRVGYARRQHQDTPVLSGRHCGRHGGTTLSLSTVSCGDRQAEWQDMGSIRWYIFAVH